MNKRLFYTLIAGLVIFSVSLGVFFYARGYKINPQNGGVEKTGMILVKSVPDGAKVFINDKLKTATNSPVSLTAGTYKVTLIKEGYSKWEKQITVEEELVTDIEALLLPLSPELKPLTIGSVSSPTLSNGKDRIAYQVKSGEKPGLWLLPLNGSPLPLLKERPLLLAADAKQASFSAAQRVDFSPDDRQLLLRLDTKRAYLLSTERLNTVDPAKTVDAEAILKDWSEETQQRDRLRARKFALGQEMLKIATASATIWSPNERRFLYPQETEGKIKYWVKNLTTPLGVGEKEDYLALETPKGANLNLRWHADSNHLILVEGSTVSLIEIDGANKTQIYSGNLASPFASPTPDGTRLIILTFFQSGSEPNLYALSLR